MIVVAEIRINAPVAAVWAAATDWVGQSQWMPLTRVGVVEGDGRSVGTRVVARTGLGPLAVVDPMTVTEWQPPRRCVVEHHGRVVRGLGVFRVEADGAGARLRWEEWLPDGGLFGALARLTGPVNRLMLALALRRFRRWVESGRSADV